MVRRYVTNLSLALVDCGHGLYVMWAWLVQLERMWAWLVCYVGVACAAGENVGVAYSSVEVGSGQLQHRVAG